MFLNFALFKEDVFKIGMRKIISGNDRYYGTLNSGIDGREVVFAVNVFVLCC